MVDEIPTQKSTELGWWKTGARYVEAAEVECGW
jgi:hypothetical protein